MKANICAEIKRKGKYIKRIIRKAYGASQPYSYIYNRRRGKDNICERPNLHNAILF